MRNILKNSAGSALTIALIGTIALGGLALIVLNQSKNYNNINAKSIADKDVDAAVLKISSLLLVPKNCNANFYGLNSTSGTLTDIRTCTSGACLTTLGTGETVELTVMDAAKLALPATAGHEWDSASSYTGLTTKVRVASINYTLDADQVAGSVTSPASLKVTIVFEKNLGTRSTGSASAKIQTSKVIREIYVPVVRRQNTPYSYPVSPTILGCPISPSSTIIQSS